MTKYNVSPHKIKVIICNGEEYEEKQVDTLNLLREVLTFGYTISYEGVEYLNLNSPKTREFLYNHVLHAHEIFLSDEDFEPYSDLPLIEIEETTGSEGYSREYLKKIKCFSELHTIISEDFNTEITKEKNLDLSEDMVNQPHHYIGEYGLEVEQVLQNFMPRYSDSYIAHRIASAVEYILRAPYKTGVQDIEKARKNITQVLDYMETKSIKEL